MSGTAAAALGLTQASGAIDSSPGGQHPTTAQFMNNIVQNETNQFGSFQSQRFPSLRRLWRLGLSRLTVIGSYPTSTANHPAGRIERTDHRSGRAHTVRPGASAPTPAAPGTIYRSPGRPLLAAEITDPAGSYSLAGASAPTLAQPGYYVPTPGASFETPDDPGYYTPYAGATAELLVQAPVISGTVSGAVHAFGAARHAVFSRPRSPIQTAHFRQSFDPDHGRRRQTVRRRRLQWAHGKRGRRLPPFGDRSRDHQRTQSARFYSEHVLRDDDIYFDRHDERAARARATRTRQ